MLVMRTLTRSWRWPRLRREFLRRRFLKVMTFGPRHLRFVTHLDVSRADVDEAIARIGRTVAA